MIIFFSENVKLPVVLIMYTPSRASHVKCMVSLREYLRDCCFVEALLDQLDISNSETKVWPEKYVDLVMLLGECFNMLQRIQDIILDIVWAGVCCGFRSSGMWGCDAGLGFPDVLKELQHYVHWKYWKTLTLIALYPRRYELWRLVLFIYNREIQSVFHFIVTSEPQYCIVWWKWVVS
jgi:hypothetical protein